MAKLNDLIVTIGATTRDFDKALGKSMRKMKTFGKNTKALGKSLSRNLTLPLAGLAAMAVKTAAEFEFSMAKVAAVSGFTADEMKVLEEQAKKLGGSTSKSASDVAGLQLELAKLGNTSSEIEAMTEQVLSLSIAFDTDLGQTASVVGATLNQFGMEASQAGRVADNMATLFGSSALDLEKFDNAMRVVGPTAHALGISLEDTGSALGILSNAGLDASTSGTSLTKAFTTLVKNGTPANKVLDKLTSGSLSVAEGFEIFGDRAGKIIPLLQGTTGELAALTLKQQENTGAAVKARKILEDTAKGGFDELRSAVEAAGITIGIVLMPAVKKITELVKKLASGLSNMSGGMSTTVVVIGGIAAAFGPLLMILPTLVNGFKLVVSGLKKVKLAMLTNPYLLLGAAVIALGSHIAGLISKQNELEEAALNARREITKQALAMRGVLNTEAATASVDDLRQGISQLSAELDKYSAKKIMQTVSFDASAKLGDIKLGAGANVLNPETQRLLKQELQQSMSVLTGQAMSQGLFGDEASAFIRNGMGRVVEGVVTEYKSGLIAKKEELQEALAEAIAGTEGGVGAGAAIASAEAIAFQQEMSDLFKADILQGADPFQSFRSRLQDIKLDLQDFDMVEEVFGDEDEWATAGDKIIENIDLVKRQTNAMAQQMSGFLQNTFTAMIEGTATFEDMMLQALKKILTQLAAMIAAFVIISLLFPGAGIATGGLGSFIGAGFGIPQAPQLHSGGLAYGPTLATVGDNKNASVDPEVIAPLSKLRGMMGGQNVVVTGKISGRDILLTSERNAIDRNRVRGF